MNKRTETKKIVVRDVQIGGNNEVIIQSMTNTKTKEVRKHSKSNISTRKCRLPNCKGSLFGYGRRKSN